MTKQSTIGIAVASIVGVAILTILVLSMFQYGEINEQNDFCANWLMQIEQQRTTIDQDWFPNWDAFNMQIDQYNAECVN